MPHAPAGAPGRDHSPQHRQRGDADEPEHEHRDVDRHSGVDLRAACQADGRQRRERDRDRHRERGGSGGDDRRSHERHERQLAVRQAEGCERGMVGSVGGDLAAEHLTEDQQRGQAREDGEEDEGERLEVDRAAGLGDGILGLGAGVDLAVARAHDAGHRAVEGGQVGEPVAQTHLEELHPGERLRRHALVVRVVLEEGGREIHRSGAAVGGVSRHRGRGRVDAGGHPHHSDHPERVGGPFGRRVLREDRRRRVALLVGGERPQPDPTADVQVPGCRSQVVDHCLVGPVGAGRPPAEEPRTLDRAEHLLVGGRERVDAADVAALLVRREEDVRRPPCPGDLGEGEHAGADGDGLGARGRVRRVALEPVHHHGDVLRAAVRGEAPHGRVGAAGPGGGRHHDPARQPHEQDERRGRRATPAQLAPADAPDGSHHRIVLVRSRPKKGVCLYFRAGASTTSRGAGAVRCRRTRARRPAGHVG